MTTSPPPSRSASAPACSANRCASTADTRNRACAADVLARHFRVRAGVPGSRPSAWARRARRSAWWAIRGQPARGGYACMPRAWMSATRWSPTASAWPPSWTDICGFILMQKSPSCGMERVKVYQDNGQPGRRHGRGLFAAALMQARPDLPVGGRRPPQRPGTARELHHPRVRLRRLAAPVRRRPEPPGAVSPSMRRYKYQLMATSRAQYQDLGRLLAEQRPRTAGSVRARATSAALMTALQAAPPPAAATATYCST